MTVNADLLDEANETYFVNLSAVTNATIADGQGLGTITDDDPLPTLSVDDVTVLEGDPGSQAQTSRSLHRHAQRTQRTNRLGRLRDGEQHRGCSGATSPPRADR